MGRKFASASGGSDDEVSVSVRDTYPVISVDTILKIVEELESADSHTRTISAQDEISYQPMISSLDILSEKINRKLDELQKLASSMAECGAGAEVERLVYASEEMKGIIRDANKAVEQYREY